MTLQYFGLSVIMGYLKIVKGLNSTHKEKYIKYEGNIMDDTIKITENSLKITKSGFSLFKIITVLVTFIVAGGIAFFMVGILTIATKILPYTNFSVNLYMIGVLFVAYISAKKVAKKLTQAEEKKLNELIDPTLKKTNDKVKRMKKLRKKFITNGYVVSVEEDDFLQFKKNYRVINIDFEQ